MSVPPPEFVTVTICEAGALAPGVLGETRLARGKRYRRRRLRGVDRQRHGDRSGAVRRDREAEGTVIIYSAPGMRPWLTGRKDLRETVQNRWTKKRPSAMTPLEAADQVSVPPPVFATVTVCVPGGATHGVGELKLRATQRDRRRRRGDAMKVMESDPRGLHDHFGDTVERRRQKRGDRRITPRGDCKATGPG